MCPLLAPPTNGSVLVSGQTVNSVAEYSCDAGFSLVGPASRTCQTSGTWTEDEPDCSKSMYNYTYTCNYVVLSI